MGIFLFFPLFLVIGIVLEKPYFFRDVSWGFMCDNLSVGSSKSLKTERACGRPMCGEVGIWFWGVRKIVREWMCGLVRESLTDLGGQLGWDPTHWHGTKWARLYHLGWMRNSWGWEWNPEAWE